MLQAQSDETPLYPAVRAVVGGPLVEEVLAREGGEAFPEALARRLSGLMPDAPAWLPHLAELERAVCECVARGREQGFRTPGDVPAPEVAPGLDVLEMPWQGLVALRRSLLEGTRPPGPPEPGRELLLLWPGRDGGCALRPARDEDLLVLKMVTEGLTCRDVAAATGAPAAGLVRILARARRDGLVLLPPSGLVRPADTHPRPAPDGPRFPENVFSSESFVLQWHVTQRCDLDCRHCYDRSVRADVGLEDGARVLEQMAGFCVERGVVGQVSFSGGNPLLHPGFFELYEHAVALGLNVAVLGNPCSGKMLDRLCEAAAPVFYQVSLEGLREHNDYIRGEGHFDRTLDFLDALRERGVSSQVMLTLTGANREQVIPLGERLAGRTDSFTFNRLAPVGQGASLACAPVDDHPAFLRRYLEAGLRRPHMQLKDSLFNVVLREAGRECFGGCTGSGCGAAYNFLSLLSDGTAHACRKMDSPVGNVHETGLAAVYDGEAAARYRAGCAACTGCELRPVCGGCLAVTKGLGLDPFTERDPYCPLERPGA